MSTVTTTKAPRQDGIVAQPSTRTKRIMKALSPCLLDEGKLAEEWPYLKTLARKYSNKKSLSWLFE